MHSLLLADHGWWLHPADTILLIGAISAAFMAIAKVPILSRPFRWVVRNLVSDPLRDSTSRVVGEIVRIESATLKDKLDSLSSDSDRIAAFVDEVRLQNEDMKGYMLEIHNCIDRRFTETHEYIERLSAYAADVFTETLGTKERIRQLYRSLDVPVFEMDARGFCTYVNPAYMALTGLTTQESMQEGWIEAVSPDDKERVSVNWSHAVENGIDFMSIFRFKDVRTGRVSQVRASARPLLNESKVAVGWIGTLELVNE